MCLACHTPFLAPQPHPNLHQQAHLSPLHQPLHPHVCRLQRPLRFGCVFFSRLQWMPCILWHTANAWQVLMQRPMLCRLGMCQKHHRVASSWVKSAPCIAEPLQPLPNACHVASAGLQGWQSSHPSDVLPLHPPPLCFFSVASALPTPSSSPSPAASPSEPACMWPSPGTFPSLNGVVCSGRGPRAWRSCNNMAAVFEFKIHGKRENLSNPSPNKVPPTSQVL